MNDYLDQRLTLSKEDEQIFRDVEDKVLRSITVGDPGIAFDFGRSLVKRSYLSGVAVAKLLWELNNKWDLFRSAGIEDEFEYVANAETGYAPATVRKYVRMWEQLFSNEDMPQEIRTALLGHPIKNLLLIGPSISNGELSEEEQWEVANASDIAEIRKVIRKATGGRTSSKNILFGAIDMSNGDLICYRSQDGKAKPVGFLDLNSDDPDVRKMIDKIIDKVQLQERN